jgi:phenylalanyl-tRNA synthetase beta chain
MVPNLLKNLRENLKHYKSAQLFEIGRCYEKKGKDIQEARKLVLAFVPGPDDSAEAFFILKGAVEDLFERVSLNSVIFRRPKMDGAFVQPGRASIIEKSGLVLGYIGEIASDVRSKYKIQRNVAIAEIDLVTVRNALPKEITYHPISKFPSVTRDLSLIMPPTVTAAEVMRVVEETGKPLVRGIEVFDVFKKDAFISIAIHIEFGSQERTLENQEVDAIMVAITEKLHCDLNVGVRK